MEHRVSGDGPVVEAEVARVEAAGGWIADGRVCDVIAVSRAFGDQEFKGAGMPGMLQKGVRCSWHPLACAFTCCYPGCDCGWHPSLHLMPASKTAQLCCGWLQQMSLCSRNAPMPAVAACSVQEVSTLLSSWVPWPGAHVRADSMISAA